METNVAAVYREIQELAGGYFIRGIPVSNIETCYEEEYKRPLDYNSLGVGNIVELIERMGDMVVMYEQRESNEKYVMPDYLVEIRISLLKILFKKLLDRHDGKIMLNNIEDIYKDHFEDELDYGFYGLSDLENLCQILNDILVVEELPSGEKVIKATFNRYNLRKRKR